MILNDFNVVARYILFQMCYDLIDYGFLLILAIANKICLCAKVN